MGCGADGKADGDEALKAENDRLRAEVGRLRAALRVNVLRLAPGTPHAEIDALVERLARGEG